MSDCLCPKLDCTLPVLPPIEPIPPPPPPVTICNTLQCLDAPCGAVPLVPNELQVYNSCGSDDIRDANDTFLDLLADVDIPDANGYTVRGTYCLHGIFYTRPGYYWRESLSDANNDALSAASSRWIENAIFGTDTLCGSCDDTTINRLIDVGQWAWWTVDHPVPKFRTNDFINGDGSWSFQSITTPNPLVNALNAQFPIAPSPSLDELQLCNKQNYSIKVIIDIAWTFDSVLGAAIDLEEHDQGTGDVTHHLFTGTGLHEFTFNHGLFTPYYLFLAIGCPPGPANALNSCSGTIILRPITPPTVTNLANDGEGSLRHVIAEAIAGDEIWFDPNLTGQIELVGGILIDKDLTIKANGSSVNSIHRLASSIDDFVIFTISSANVKIIGLTVDAGQSTISGGGIINTGGTSQLVDVVVSNCSAVNGGGIYNSGTLTMINCAVTGNTATHRGGGIFNIGTLNMTLCDVNDNESTSDDGGGIFNSGTATFLEGDMNGNTSGFRGGGCFNEGTFTVETSTMDSNTAQKGTAIANTIGTVSIKRCTMSRGLGSSSLLNELGTVSVLSSTFSGNFGAGVETNQGATDIKACTFYRNHLGIFNGADGYLSIKMSIVCINGTDLLNEGDMDSGGYNLFGVATGLIAGVGDRTGITGPQIKLEELFDNGGPTKTHALREGSVALDAGTNVGAEQIDQRGSPRIVTGTADIGAYESSDDNPVQACVSPDAYCVEVPYGGDRAAAQAEMDQLAKDQAQAILDGGYINLVSNSLPPGSVGVDYDEGLSATGGTGPYHYFATGATPFGILLEDGRLVGTPTVAGDFSFTVTITGTTGLSCHLPVTISVT